MAKIKFTARTKARKRAVDVVFEADQKGFGHIPHLLRDLLVERCEISPAQAPMNDFSKAIVNGVAGHIDEIDDWIIRFLRNTSLDRLPATDRAILRVATWEVLYNDEIDSPIVIKEAILLAEAIGGTDNSPAFVNAVIANIAKAAAERDDYPDGEADTEPDEGPGVEADTEPGEGPGVEADTEPGESQGVQIDADETPQDQITHTIMKE